MLMSLLRALCSLVLKFSLYLLAISVAVLVVFGNSTRLKQSLRNSHAYDTFVDDVLSQVERQEAAEPQANTLPIKDPVVQQAAKQAFSPAVLQKDTESFLDGMYDWLGGKTAAPQFAIDLGRPKSQFADSVSQYASQRLTALPACTAQQLRALSVQAIDAFDLPCRPPGLNINAEQARVSQNLLSSVSFGKDGTVVTAADLPKDSHGQGFTEQYKLLPKAFQLTRILPWVLGILILLTSCGVIYLAKERRQGTAILARAFMGSGLFLLLSTLLYVYGFKQVNSPSGVLSRVNDNATQKTLSTIINALGTPLNTILMSFSIAYIVIGVAILLVRFLTRPKAASPAAVPEATTPAPPPISNAPTPVPPPDPPEETPPSPPTTT